MQGERLVMSAYAVRCGASPTMSPTLRTMRSVQREVLRWG